LIDETPLLTPYSNPKIKTKKKHTKANRCNDLALNNDPRLPPGFPKSLPPLDKDEIKQTDALIANLRLIVHCRH
jgi:hypothetical protein